MQVDPRPFTATESAAAYRRFFVVSALIAGGLALVGILPTRQVAGEEALPSMLLGIAVAFAASFAGTLPIYQARHRTPLEAMPAQFGAMALRLLVALVLGVALALSGLAMVKPFLLWLAIAHSGLLVADTLFARSMVQKAAEQHATGAVEAHSR